MAIEETQLPDLSAPQRTHWYPEREDITLFGVLNALADPLRLEIVRNLDKHEERCPYDFLEMTSKPVRLLCSFGVRVSRIHSHQACLNPAMMLLLMSPVGVSVNAPVTLIGPSNNFCSADNERSQCSSVL